MILRHLFVCFFVVFSVSLVACSEDPQNPVGGPKAGGDGQSAEAEKEIKSLVYIGKTNLNYSCKVYLALEPEEEEGANVGEEHEHHYIAAIDYEVPPTNPDKFEFFDTHLSFFEFDGSKFANEYSEFNPGLGDSTRALVAVDLKEDSGVTDPDPNKLQKYISDQVFSQYMSLRFNAMNLEEFEEALEAVLVKGEAFEAHKSTLLQLSGVKALVKHTNHEDLGQCGAFASATVENRKFELGASHNHD